MCVGWGRGGVGVRESPFVAAIPVVHNKVFLSVYPYSEYIGLSLVSVDIRSVTSVCSGPEWPSGESGGFPVGSSAPHKLVRQTRLLSL